MTEIEFMNLSAQVLESSGVVTATSFTLVFGYLAGLYFFVGRAPFVVRSLAFAFFSVCMMWMWAGLFAVVTLIRTMMQTAEISISTGHTYVGMSDQMLVFWMNYNDAAMMGLNAIIGLTWLSLLYATFFFKWDRA